MESFEQDFVLLELKYCERCGGLWLRLRGSEMAFCTRCAKAMACADSFTSAAGDHSCEEPFESALWAEGGNA
jgi:hypothetical protein